ncbi:MAG: translation initiation factor IF-3 [Lachnospiraceae bacterium]|nr:translation initiation factor IF-3 [Lachnospiraceae bacterium]
MINDQIREAEVRVISEEGEMLGVMPTGEALRKADDAGLDLIMISPNANPPVCRIEDFGKFRYEQLRKEKENKKKQKVTEVKEIRFSPNIDTNDFNTKMNAARKFLTKGEKVKVTVRFRGREMAHGVPTAKKLLDDFAEGLSDVASLEKEAKVEGRSIAIVLAEKK